MPNTLVSSEDIDVFPGSPFHPVLVDAAAASIRAEAGWHIAPVITETITVNSYGDSTLLALPTQRIVSVTAVRDVTTTPLVLTGWGRSSSGSLYRAFGWPSGVLEVDLEHGFDETPPELLPILASRARQASNPRDPSLAARSSAAGPFTESETYRTDGGTTAVDPTIARYSVRVGLA